MLGDAAPPIQGYPARPRAEAGARTDGGRVPGSGLGAWLRNVAVAVVTVVKALWVTARVWMRTYDPRRRTFTERYEYPERAVPVAPRFRGFHRYDLTSCIGCERCARDCPVGCIYISKERVGGRKGFRVTSYVIDYSKCMFCALCTESCPVDCIFMGSSHDLSCYSRDGCIVDFARLPREVAWGRARLDALAVWLSKRVTHPVAEGPSL